jgi:hypothetical protein
MLIERLAVDKTLRRLCGWEHRGEVCSEATFSRAFAEFAHSALPSRIHEALIKRTYEDRLVGHISRDATAIEAREKPVKTAPPAASTAARPKRKRGRPRKGEVVEKKEPRRLERQGDMSLAEMLAELPRHCAVGTKRNAKAAAEGARSRALKRRTKTGTGSPVPWAENAGTTLMPGKRGMTGSNL